MEEAQDQQKNRKSMVITAAVQVVMLLIMYILVAWREPNPPIPEYGIELSFGVATGGSNVQPREQPVTTPAPVETQESAQPQQPQEAESSAAEGDESVEEPSQGDLPIEDAGEPNAPDTESEESESTEPSETEQQPTESEATAEQNTRPAVQQPVQEIAEEAAPASENSDVESAGVGNDQGDEVQGEPAAEIDQRALYGNVTGQEGASLQMSGWVWDFEPTPKDDSQESGKIVYKITIDDEGYIISIVPQTSTVSPTVEKYYRQAVERLTFSKTSSYKPAPTSEGTITFTIKTK